MRILFLTHRLPYPPNKGDKIRSFHILSHLAARHEVHLACPVDDEGDFQHLPALRERVASVSVARIGGGIARMLRPLALLEKRPISLRAFYSRALQSSVDRVLAENEFDCVFAFSSPMAEYLFHSSHWSGGLRRCLKIMDFIDVDSAKWADYASRSRGLRAWVYARESRLLADYETRVAREFDRSFLVSAAELDALPPGLLREKVQALPNGVDFDYFAPRPRDTSGPPRVVFTGAMDYRPNVEGVEWFVQKVWPLVKKRYPDACFDIVGSKPAERVRALAREPGVQVTGFVPDVRTYVAAASVCVAPLLIARGVQNKVLEAMAMARPVVCTPQALEGIPARHGEQLLTGSSPAEFAEAVMTLLADPARALEMGARARECVEQHHRWSRTLAPLDEMLK